jgi:hypothetical protein
MNKRQDTSVDADATAWIAGLTNGGEVAFISLIGKPEIAVDTLKSK